MINGQILVQEFYDKESCIFAGKLITTQLKSMLLIVYTKETKNNGNT
jgi:hypothetical protein